MSTTARRVLNKVLTEDLPSHALYNTTSKHVKRQNYTAETTTYIFLDGSKLEDCNGEIRIIK